MVIGGRAASVLPLNLPHLQNLIKRDSESYRTEFLLQQNHFYSTLGLLQASGWDVTGSGGDASEEGSLENLITFMSHVVPCFSDEKIKIKNKSKKVATFSSGVLDEAERFVTTLMDLLEREAASLPASLRRCMCQALILMRSKKGGNLIPTEKMLKLFFRLFGLKDKNLRVLLYEAIVSDIRKANHPHRNNALNRSLQNFMYSIFTTSTGNGNNGNNGIITTPSNNILNANTSSSDEMRATKSLQVIIELYRRGIWNDGKTVNIIAEAALKGNCPKAMVMALNFFLGKYPESAEIGADEEDSNETAKATSTIDGNGTGSKASIASSEEYRSLLHACQVGGVSKAKSNRLKRILASDRKRARASENPSQSITFSPLSMVNDPQEFSERLYRQLKGSNGAFEMKLLMMNVLSRFIGWHKLLVLDFYSFLLRYFQPHQRSVTQILAYTAQATHALIPPDTLYPVLRAIADNFVSEGAAEPIIAAGLNGIREICTRAPLAMTETLLQDLTGYKKGGDHKNKGVMMAARSLISLFRELNPELLHRRDRGRDVSMAIAAGTQKKSLAYGEVEKYEVTEEAVTVKTKTSTEFNNEKVDSDPESDDNDNDNDNIDVFSVTDSNNDSDNDNETESESDLGHVSDLSDLAENSDFEDSELSIDINTLNIPAFDHKNKNTQTKTKTTSVSSKRVKFLPSERLLLPEDYEKKPPKQPQRGYQIDTEIESEDSESSDEDSDSSGDVSEIIEPSKIEGYRSRAKADYEERLASIHAGREGREKFGSRKRGNSRSSTTNKEKSKGKNFLMMAHKFEIQGKRRRSLKVKQAVQKKHKITMKRKR